MPPQDVASVTPRVRRAVEGPVSGPSSITLTDSQILALTADAIADVILFTGGAWKHKLLVSHRDSTTNFPDQWEVDPELLPEEESMIAAQAAISFYFHVFKDKKINERIVNEGQEWEYSLSASMLKDLMAALRAQRDAALESLKATTPVLARYESILLVRDRVGAAMLEPWVQGGGLGGGIELVP